MQVEWADIKSLVSSGQTRLNFIERANEYLIIASATNVAFECFLDKDTPEAIEFESDFKAQWVNISQPIDSDGSLISRNKTTRTGWHFEPRSIDFTAGVAGSLYNRKHDGNTIDTGTDYGDASISFFDASGVAITQNGETLEQWQTRLNANCVRTQIDWQPTYDMDLIGTHVGILNAPDGIKRAYSWIIIAPDIPEFLAGSVPFLSGGWNLRHFKNSPSTFLDGRGVYTMLHDPDYNSNKIRVIIKHELNSNIELQFVAEHFKQ